MAKENIDPSLLRCPNIRDELLAYLKDCSEVAHFESSQDVDFDVHFFFDDHDFASNPNGMIGEVFYDLDEVEALSIFIHEFEKAIGPGRSMPNPANVDWSPVAAAAHSAYQAIAKTRLK
ncbi:hypothetical protein [Asticcacaulis excentricus]|uniref:Uncharacterized protein n=1 Tax=Asticcacaulis excentricus (strain ATCC 15261 / DSM 4724 / KCTC 12464 / NCIMB 9791 / VKM B-1370 / CB 48) TaxID=573065 RepID=E8RQV9_ASTEC|nr:hypothetical protein [Asticcacaulis excentricus]ADU12222.1 hypothetical protein Astex_0531 [Asticcacaulis excentricus CB 48]